MSALDDLAAGYARLKQGTLWHSTGKCKGFADANPGEAAKLDAYVAALVTGGSPSVPALATATGDGLARIIAAGLQTVAPPPTPGPPPAPSPDRFVWCLGDPAWNYEPANPGWAFDEQNYKGGLSSTGWKREAAGVNAITPQRVYFDDTVQVMQSVAGSYGQPGTSGPCRTVAARIDGGDPNVPGIVSGAQAAQLRIDSSQDVNPFWGPRPSVLPLRGETWWYGFAFATNPGFVPHGYTADDPTFGNFNNLMSWHSSSFAGIGDGWGVGVSIGNRAPAGSQPGDQFSAYAALAKTAAPYIEVNVSGGDMANRSAQTALRFRGPDFVAGRLYRVVERVEWSADQTGELDVYIDGLQYVHAAGISQWWKNGAAYDASPYPLLYNYRKSNVSLPSNIVYYGGLIRGSTMADVTIP